MPGDGQKTYRQTELQTRSSKYFIPIPGRSNQLLLVQISNFSHCQFLPAQRYASSGTSYGPVSVCVCPCPSGTSRCSIKTDERIDLVLARRLLSTSPALLQGNPDIYKNKATSPCNFFLNFGLKKFRPDL